MSILDKKLAVALLVLFTISFIGNTSKNLLRYWQMQKNLDAKKEQLSAIISENDEIKKRLITLNDNELEAMVRDKLGMVKLGETVVILPEDLIKLEEKETDIEPEVIYSNWQKWLNLFIKGGV